MIFVQILFWFSVIAVIYSFFIYPILLQVITQTKKPSAILFTHPDEFPVVSVLMAVYNEEQVLESKLQSLLASDYPKEKLHIFIGNDNSIDKTVEIINQYAPQFANFTLVHFEGRNGKPNIINALAAKSNTLLGLEQSGYRHGGFKCVKSFTQ
jgi:cellulose synthase/poly-beta-1,6-N-acetylglucosamine synthase-like glycosyltransferase